MPSFWHRARRWFLRQRLKRQYPTTWPLDHSRYRLRLCVTSPTELDTRCYSCSKEPELISWLDSTLRPGDVLYDVGANVGAYSLVAGAYFNQRGGQVYAIEPAFYNYTHLCRNIILNNLQHRIIPVCIALSDRTGFSLLHYATLEAGGALHACGQAVNYEGNRFQPRVSIPALTYSLDEARKQFGWPAPTHLKLDVDGTEWEVLQGARESLRTVRHLFIELDERHPRYAESKAYLEGCGFYLQSSHPVAASGPYVGIANYLWSRSS